jgi:glycosyltransferase involved in cell wall biosynthesis
VDTDTRLAFVGSMDWYPNEDAALYLIECILPLIRREMPDVRLSIVGRNPSARLRQVASTAAVAVTGTVADVRPHMAESAVLVAPLRIAGGARLKIFEAMAMAKPVVSTSVGAEGLPVVPGKHLLIADDPPSFASEVVALIRDAERRKELGAAGLRLVAERYSWPRVTRDFEAACFEALSRRTVRP